MHFDLSVKKLRESFLSIKDEPHAIALGVAIGVYFGFIPLFGLKTLLAIGVTALCKGNKLAAAVAVTAHDVLLPIFPILLRWEYDVGYWLLSSPHEFPAHMHLHHPMGFGTWLHWSTFLTIGRPMLLGAALMSVPIAVLTYFVTLKLVQRRQLA